MSSNSEEIPGLMGIYRRKPKLVYTNQGEASRKKQRSEDVKYFLGWTGIEREKRFQRKEFA